MLQLRIINIGSIPAPFLVCIAAILILAFTVNSAASETPACSLMKEDNTPQAPSAGCMVVHNGKLLVIESYFRRIGPPGGSTNVNESAPCAAERETWEETGLQVTSGKLLKRFDNGFELYQCQLKGNSTTNVIRPLEVRRSFWLSSDEFSNHRWRFPSQQGLLKSLLQQSPSKAE